MLESPLTSIAQTGPPLPVLPTVLLEPGLRAKIAGWYRELALDNHALGQRDLAADAELKAAALEYGGTVNWSAEP